MEWPRALFASELPRPYPGADRPGPPGRAGGTLAPMTTGLLHGFEHGMFVRTAGAGGSGRTVVWVHGLGESGLCFERLIRHDALAGLRHVVPDLPGYGRSPRPAHAPDLAAVADHLAAWLAARGEPAPVVVGHSMGGAVGVLLAERYPHRLAALVSIEGNVSPGDCTFSGRAAGQSLRAFAGGGLDALRDQVRADGADQPALRGYHASLALADPRVFHRHAQDLVALSADGSMAARLAGLPVPVTVVAGVPGGLAPRSLELLEGAGVRCVRIEPAGHWPFVDRPDEVAGVVAGIAAAA
jgi:pimeloyl-ACP methyl ester carboxylesterase